MSVYSTSLHHLFVRARELGLAPPNTATRKQLLAAIKRRRVSLARQAKIVETSTPERVAS